MIISKKVKVKVNNLNYKRLLNLNYKCKMRDEIEIDIKELSNGSKCLVNVICDVCDVSYHIPYLAYNRQTNFGQNKLYCNKCKSEKSKNTSIEKYGVDHPMKNDIFKDKLKKSNLEKYGVENVFSSDEIKEKIKKTNLDKYGKIFFTNPEKMILTKKEKYGNDFNDIKEKYEKTCIEKYGVRSTMFLENFISKKNEYFKSNNYQISENRKKTCMERYGVENVFSSDEVKEKIKKINIEKYSVQYPFQNSEFLNKCKISLIEKYGVNNPSKSKLIQDRKLETLNRINIKKYSLIGIVDNQFQIECKLCNNIFLIEKTLFYNRVRLNTIVCVNCFPPNSYSNSGKENIIFNLIKDYIIKIIKNDRQILEGKELDIYLPDLKLAFEFNGLYWHSEIYKEKNYHLNKTKLCLSKGINLFHIWEDDWNNKQNILKSMILNKLGKSERIFARKCQVKVVDDNKLIRNFLVSNHIQGFVGSKIKLGLFYDNELVSLMTFGNLRKSLGQVSKDDTYELLRFCNKLNTSVIGGASKLFNYFLSNYQVNEIISYSDLSRSNGNMYQQLGFTLEHNSDPNYYYIIDNLRKHRFNFRKDKLIREGADPLKTEIAIMHERGFYRIWDCGMQKWIYTTVCLTDKES